MKTGLKLLVEKSELRRRTMQAVKSKNTSPELKVRRLLHSHGYRYRLHSSELPGKPDIVFPSRKSVIFINGCFWHGHTCRHGSRRPKTNKEYWESKIERNMQRDSANLLRFVKMGWKCLVVWECEIKNIENLKLRLFNFLG